MAAKSSGDGQGVMVSNLPLLFACGNPTSLSAMSGADLQHFIPFLVKCALGQEPKSWESLPKPYWWPDDVPYSIRSLNSGTNDAWTSKLRVLVNNCYINHGCKYLLDFSAYLRDCDRKGVQYQKNNDGTTSMFEANGGKLLVTFRDENREYDLALRRAPIVNMTAVPSLPSQLHTPQLMANLQRASAPYRGLSPNQQSHFSSQRFLAPSPTQFQGGSAQPRPFRARPVIRPAMPQGRPLQQSPQALVRAQITPQEQLQLLLNRPDLAIRPVNTSKPSTQSQQTTSQPLARAGILSKAPQPSSRAPSTSSSQNRVQNSRPLAPAPSRPVGSQPSPVGQPGCFSTLRQEVAAALQRKLNASVTVRPKINKQLHVPQNVAHIIKSLQENRGNGVTIQLPGTGVSIRPSGPSSAGPSPEKPVQPQSRSIPSTSGSTLVQVSPASSTKLVPKIDTPKSSPIKPPQHRPTLLPKLSRAGSQKDDIVDIYLCDYCDEQFTSLQQTKIHESTCKARQSSSSNKSQLRNTISDKPPEQEIIEINADNQTDFMKCFGMMPRDKASKSEEGKNRRFVPKMIDDTPRKLFLAHQGRYMNIALSCAMGRTFVTLSSKLLNAAALRPQIERYDRLCSTSLDEVGHTIRVSARDTSLLALRLQSGVRRARDYQHDYCFSSRERRARYRYLKTGLSKRSRNLKRACKKPVLKIHKLSDREIVDWKRYIVEDFRIVHHELTNKIKKACPLPKKLEIIGEVTPKYTKMTPRVPPIRIRAMPNGAMSITTADKPSKAPSGANTPVKLNETNGPAVPETLKYPTPVPSMQNGHKVQKARKSFSSSNKFSTVQELKEFMTTKALEGQTRGVKRRAAFFAGRRRKKRRTGVKRPIQTAIKSQKDVNANPPLGYHTDSDGSLHSDGKKLTREQRSLLNDECKELRSKGLSSLLLTEKGHVTRRSVHMDSPVPSESPVAKHFKMSPVPPTSPLLLQMKQEGGDIRVDKSLFYGAKTESEPVTAVVDNNVAISVVTEVSGSAEDSVSLASVALEPDSEVCPINGDMGIHSEILVEVLPPILSEAALEIVSVAPLEIVSVAPSVAISASPVSAPVNIISVLSAPIATPMEVISAPTAPASAPLKLISSLSAPVTTPDVIPVQPAPNTAPPVTVSVSPAAVALLEFSRTESACPEETPAISASPVVNNECGTEEKIFIPVDDTDIKENKNPAGDVPKVDTAEIRNEQKVDIDVIGHEQKVDTDGIGHEKKVDTDLIGTNACLKDEPVWKEKLTGSETSIAESDVVLSVSVQPMDEQSQSSKSDTSVKINVSLDASTVLGSVESRLCALFEIGTEEKPEASGSGTRPVTDKVHSATPTPKRGRKPAGAGSSAVTEPEPPILAKIQGLLPSGVSNPLLLTPKKVGDPSPVKLLVLSTTPETPIRDSLPVPQVSRPSPRVSPRERKAYSPAEYIVPRIGRRSLSPGTKANRELKRLQRDECKELKQKGLENLQVKNGRLTRARLKGPKDDK